MTARDLAIAIPAGADEVVEGDLVVPGGAVGLVVFAHGSGSSRHSGRNRHVARLLQERGLATLLMDLLTADEERIDQRTREHRFDIDLLGHRLLDAIEWARGDSSVAALPIGCFGASTGAAAALVAAARRPDDVAAVVSRGGRPDLAGAALGDVRAPTLLLVGGRDEQVIELNRRAAAQLVGARWELEIVPGATHLFEEPGALDVVADRTGSWFLDHLPPATDAHGRSTS